jgi:UDPglucose--hexose-1-phosphate uridylyltransferase
MNTTSIFATTPHRRCNLLTGEWVLVSPHRAERPWQGKVEDVPIQPTKVYEPSCYLCPTNMRANGVVNPNYSATHVFENDFPALFSGRVDPVGSGNDLLKFESLEGTCRVIVYTPQHNLTPAELSLENHRAIVEVWAEQYAELHEDFAYVQIFENKGIIMGCSNSHAHGQVWAHNHIPSEMSKELESFESYWRAHSRNLLIDYVELELKEKVRTVLQNEHWVVLVPFWASWPFETLLVPIQRCARFGDLGSEQKQSLASIQKSLLEKYDRLFDASFPFSFGWHSRPSSVTSEYQLHAHYYPPLLRSATVKKFMVGYEMLAEPQRDITAESAALRLREL